MTCGQGYTLLGLIATIAIPIVIVVAAIGFAYWKGGR
jgi:hypothetical protein